MISDPSTVMLWECSIHHNFFKSPHFGEQTDIAFFFVEYVLKKWLGWRLDFP